jgi:hypothetical protein
MGFERPTVWYIVSCVLKGRVARSKTMLIYSNTTFIAKTNCFIVICFSLWRNVISLVVKISQFPRDLLSMKELSNDYYYYYYKQPRMPTRGGPPAWGLGEVLTTPLRKKHMLRITHKLRCFLWRQKDRDRWRALLGTVRNFRVP